MEFLRRLLEPGLARLTRAWHGSLHLRVVSITLVSSTLLVVTFSWLLASQITAGQVGTRLEHAKQELEKGRTFLEPQLATRTDPKAPGLNDLLVYYARLRSDNQPDGRDKYYVLIKPDATMENFRVYPQSRPETPSGKSIEYLVPPELARLVEGDPGKIGDEGTGEANAYQYTRIDPDGNGERPFIVVGTKVRSAMNADFYLYYFFPLNDEVASANSVRNTVIVAGVALVLLLALLSALVTHLVVGPVRIAARTAHRLSAGLLDQRMEVKGSDDLAGLATSFNQMAANLQSQINRLEEMSRLQRRFTSDVSHELRTPLTTVRMAADLIFSSREDFDPAVSRSAELLQAELDRFEDLLTDLLEISRFDAGFAQLDTEAVDLVPIVRRVVDRLHTLADRAGVALEVDVPAEPVIAEVDPRRVERVLRNLVGNAVEHGERRPVLVTLAAGEGAAAVTVRDHGIGLNPGEEKLVFNRFWRADPSRARQTGGTGLGLSISLEDARLHNGWLEAWGAPGLGAQFRLTVPLRAGDRLLSSPLRLVPADAEAELGPIPPDEPLESRHA
ncbi:MtrAB system histidine kinase MtrB [Longispora albida]|uniref:MtrAB system histidine kinase MtrB n=1 Tax=Longispora albida TaxID=203523 RepID=UPI00037BFB0A|nr:MtrAB system histidine kinase MtrB [Longispora albida]